MHGAEFQHQVGALGGGNDVDSGDYTLAEAYAHCASLPGAVGFTYEGLPAFSLPRSRLYCMITPLGSTRGSDE